MTWFELNQAYLLIPVAVSVWAWFRCRDEWDMSFWTLVLASALATGVSGVWRASSDAVSLHMLPVFFLALVFLGFWGIRFSPVTAYAGAFITLLSADLAQASLEFINTDVLGLYKSPPSLFSYLGGIGGAGWQDALFVTPFLAFLTSLYMHVRVERTQSQPVNLPKTQSL